MKCKRLTLNPYGSAVYITTSRKAFLKQYRKLGGTKLTKACVADSQGYCSRFGPVYVVGIFGGGANTLVHELTHVCMFEAVRTNFHNDNSNDEALAYLMGNTTEQALAALPEILEQ